jgi:hypothetical protein
MDKVTKLFLVLGVAVWVVIGIRIVPASAQQIDRTQLPRPETQYKYRAGDGRRLTLAVETLLTPGAVAAPSNVEPNVALLQEGDDGMPPMTNQTHAQASPKAIHENFGLSAFNPFSPGIEGQSAKSCTRRITSISVYIFSHFRPV